MKVVTSETMRNLDRQAINDFGIPGRKLMENAGRNCAEIIINEFGEGKNRFALILAGKGNNGGDGYVIARLLTEKGWNVKVIVLAEREQIGGDAAFNLELLPSLLVSCCTRQKELSDLFREETPKADLIVDALLGTGLGSEVSGVYREAIELINNSGRPVLSVDIPSGIHGTTGNVLGYAVRADITVTFAFAKLGHVLYPGGENVGRLIVTDIGIPQELMEQTPGHEFLNEQAIRPLLRRRDRHGHKGNFGHCLFIAGSRGKTGAAALCANTAVRTGSGLVTLAIPDSLNPVLEIKTTEAMTVPLPESPGGYLADNAYHVIMNLMGSRDALAIGPGIDHRPGTVTLVRNLVESVEIPMVIDADGLNALALDTTILSRKKSTAVVLTPHPGEMARLLGGPLPEDYGDRIRVALEFASNFGVFLILKGARTIITSPDGRSAINGSGNPGMASGGMGDVLTGVITSLLGQGYGPWDACRLGVFIHGYSADMVAGIKGEIGISATDVQENIPYAYQRLTELNPDVRPNQKRTISS